jgi:hypothetical protein
VGVLGKQKRALETLRNLRELFNYGKVDVHVCDWRFAALAILGYRCKFEPPGMSYWGMKTVEKGAFMHTACESSF